MSASPETDERSLARELRLGRALLPATLLAFAAYLVLTIAHGGNPLETGLVTGLSSFLVYGNVAYQLARLGYLRRLRGHVAPAAERLRFDPATAPRVAILVPSYREEARVVRQTLLSAALQEYPRSRVTLLIDDPPEPGDEALEAARRLPAQVAELLAEPRALIAATDDLAATHAALAGWLRRTAAAEGVDDHTDAFFVRRVLLAGAERHEDHARELDRRDLPPAELAARRRALAAAFDVELTSFERKLDPTLSHAPNKAMNLNSFIGLLGTDGREDAEYVLTLDADSILLPEYTALLVELLERPEHARVAVAQTPYSAVPGPSSLLERIAGATTDVQYVIHQGFTAHRATFWVGANAVLRKRALEEIATVEEEDGLRVRKFIQDRTVIEDTESTIDLIRRGWQLLNYPRRLSYSATPPDFGALVVQRRRWANGGLLILPKLLRYLVERPRRTKLREVFLRVHYLSSIAGANLALLAVLALPVGDGPSSFALAAAAVPYFVLYGRDLVHAGYRRSDLVRVYALNLLLLPVNLAGVAKSLEQACTRRKIPFSRTPKVPGRTATHPAYLLAAQALLLSTAFAAVVDAQGGRPLHAAFDAANAGLLLYAITRFVGWRSALTDVARAVMR